MVTLLPVVLARDQLTTPFGGSIAAEHEARMAEAVHILINLKTISFAISFILIEGVG